MLRKIAAYIKEHQMIREGSHVIAGVSGGADSMCLLLALLQLRAEFGHTVSAVHVEHGIRGEAARRDAEFVRHFCEKRSIECHIRRFHVPEYAKAHGIGEEEAGRQLRYAAFEAEKKIYEKDDAGCSVKIAVAHHLGDQAETMLFHLARGTGIRGLAGIAPVRGSIIRPLLAVGRNEIERYLAENQQDFCQDATNGENTYSRNKIRHLAVPVLEQVNSRAVQHMYRTAQELREIDAYIKMQAAEELKRCRVYLEDGIKIEKEAFLRAHPVLQKEMLHEALAETAGSSRDISREHTAQLLALFARQAGRQLMLPYGLRAVRVYGGIEIFSAENRIQTEKKEAGCEKNQFTFRLIENISDYTQQICKKKYTKCFDYDKIKDGFCVRNRLPGDYLAVNDSGDRQKLKKYLINEKIPVREREQLLLLADGAHIMWVVGYRISSYYKVDQHTRRILEVTFNGGKEDE